MLTFFKLLSRLGQSRPVWLTIAVCSAALLAADYFLLQKTLYIAPSELTVYIRLGLIVMIAGALVACINPAQEPPRAIGWLLSVVGSVYGSIQAWKLSEIHTALRSGTDAAILEKSTCSLQPSFPMDLPLQQWLPDLFTPTAPCGVDTPLIPAGTQLSGFAQHLTDAYTQAGGWYLIPSQHFMSLGDLSMLVLDVAVVLYVLMMPSIFDSLKNRR